MNFQLTPELLDFLKAQGYRYCYSKTSLTLNEDVEINLVPTMARPRVRYLPRQFDTYFNLSYEPVQMAEGIEGVYISVAMDSKLSKLYINEVIALARQAGGTILIVAKQPSYSSKFIDVSF